MQHPLYVWHGTQNQLMIYRIVNKETGEIVRSLDAPLDIAKLYLTDGHELVTAGDGLMLDDARLCVSGDRLVRQPGVEDAVTGEGSKVTRVA